MVKNEPPAAPKAAFSCRVRAKVGRNFKNANFKLKKTKT